MIEMTPAKALSVTVNEDMRLCAVGKGKGRMLTFDDMVFVLPKLDGVYAIKSGGKLRTRTMAPFRRELQDRFAAVPDGVCGELIVGHRLAADAWAKTVSDVNRKEGSSNAVLHMFDYATEGKFAARYARLRAMDMQCCTPIEASGIIHVNKGVMKSDPLLLKLRPQPGEVVEGLVLRPASMSYLATRSSALRPFFMRIKGEETVDAEILSFSERMHNANEAKDTHDGKLRRHSFKDNLIPTGMAGSMEVKLPDGKLAVVGTGFDMSQAKDFWQRREELRGTVVELKRHEHVRVTLSNEKSEQGAYVFLRLRADKTIA